MLRPGEGKQARFESHCVANILHMHTHTATWPKITTLDPTPSKV